MKSTLKILCWTLSLLIICSVIGICYAAISGSLDITGDATFTPKVFKGVYISEVSVHAQNGLSDVDYEYIKPTNLESTTTVSAQNASITYAVTVHNNTDVTYWYTGPEFLGDYGSNALINATGGIFITTKDYSDNNSPNFDTADWLPPGAIRTFYATYSFGPNATGTVSTLVNFSFGLHMDAVHDGFLNVLNDKTSELGYYYLSGLFDEKYANEQKTVLGSIGKDADALRNIFGSDLSINVDGMQTPVTIMIERKNVDGNANSGDSYSGTNALSGCEYTVYITVDDLNSPNGTATVYAVSYTCGADGYWYQIGELYEGTSIKADYDTSTGEYEGAFDVSTWEATENVYQVTDDISYKVGYEQGTTYDKITSLEDLMTVHDQEFYNKVNNSSGNLLKPVCLVVYSYTHNSGQYIESENYDNKYNQGYAALKNAFDKIKPYCLIANGAQEVKIQNADSLTRAQLIQLLEEIQNAYDYYVTVNPS